MYGGYAEPPPEDRRTQAEIIEDLIDRYVANVEIPDSPKGLDQ